MATTNDQDDAVDPRAAALHQAWFGKAPISTPEVEAHMARWFKPDAATDAAVAKHFGPFVDAANRGELDAWGAHARGRLVLVLLLDQAPRQLHRGSAEAFASDARALELTVTGLDQHMDLALTSPFERAFFYMPLQHAETLPMQTLSVEKFTALAADPGLPEFARGPCQGFVQFAQLHYDIVAQFGRFPHRNRSLGRASTNAELAFLEGGGPSFGQ